MLRRLWAYLWVAPVTVPCLFFLPLAYLTGGRAQIVRGVLEIHGGLITVMLKRWLLRPAAAMTLGHIILGRDQQCLEHSRTHEHVHVRQYERWGILMLPIYLGASTILYLRGFDPYLDNPFEREAFAEGDL